MDQAMSDGHEKSNGTTTQAAATDAGPVFIPPADIREKGGSIVMVLDVPGADPAGLDVTLEKRVLIVSAKVRSSSPEGYAPAHMEFHNGTYERRFVFSDQMDGDNIQAALKDGVLRLTVPKAPETSAKKIAVATA